MTVSVAARPPAPTRARTAHPAPLPSAEDIGRRLRRMERTSALGDLGLVLEELSARYRELSASVIRQQAVEVLCLGAPDRLTPALVGRLVEARLLALL